MKFFRDKKDKTEQSREKILTDKKIKCQKNTTNPRDDKKNTIGNTETARNWEGVGDF